MAGKSILIYDIETLCPVLTKDTIPIEGIKYANGFDDYAGLGIACLCAYLVNQDSYRVFDMHNIGEFKELIEKHDLVVGFNSHKFDNNLLIHFGITTKAKIAPKSYDILRNIYLALGLNPDGPYYDKRYRGNKLENIAQLNLGIGKVLDGQLAPVLWQQGQYAKVVDYCLDDVRLTKKVFDIIVKTGGLKTVHGSLKMVNPYIFAGAINDDWG